MPANMLTLKLPGKKLANKWKMESEKEHNNNEMWKIEFFLSVNEN